MLMTYIRSITTRTDIDLCMLPACCISVARLSVLEHIAGLFVQSALFGQALP